MIRLPTVVTTLEEPVPPDTKDEVRNGREDRFRDLTHSYITIVMAPKRAPSGSELVRRFDLINMSTSDFM